MVSVLGAPGDGVDVDPVGVSPQHAARGARLPHETGCAPCVEPVGVHGSAMRTGCVRLFLTVQNNAVPMPDGVAECGGTSACFLDCGLLEGKVQLARFLLECEARKVTRLYVQIAGPLWFGVLLGLLLRGTRMRVFVGYRVQLDSAPPHIVYQELPL